MKIQFGQPTNIRRHGTKI